MRQGQNQRKAQARKTIGARSHSVRKRRIGSSGSFPPEIPHSEAFKPVRTLGHVFRRPKDRPAANRIAGIVTVGFSERRENGRPLNMR